MKSCKFEVTRYGKVYTCGSFQFNLHQENIDQGDLCDVHYWQNKYINIDDAVKRYLDLVNVNLKIFEDS